MAVKVSSKKPARKAVKKAAPAKKSVSSKKTARKPAKKAAPAKKPARKAAPAKKAAKKPLKKAASAKKASNRVPPRVVRKAPVIVKAQPAPAPEVDTKAAVAFAMSIAEEMKRSAKREDEKRNETEIRLARRPTSRSKGRNTVKFPAADLADFRKRLLEEREQALAGVDAMKATGFNEADDHEADGGDGTNQTLRLQALGQMGQINRTIQKIEEALHRIEDGTYGVCTVCGQLIRKPRLLNQPFVLTCMECQSDMEKNRF